MDFVSATLGPALDFGGSLMNNLFSRSSQKKALKQQLWMYNDMKEYNKPVNQMARLQEAGLNPNLVYGNLSGGSGNTVNNTPNVEPVWGGSIDAGALGKIPGAIEEYKQKKANSEILKNQVKGSKINLDIQREIQLKTKAEAGYIAAQTLNVLSDSSLKRWELDHYNNYGYDKHTSGFIKNANYVTGRGKNVAEKRIANQKNLYNEELDRLYRENEDFLQRYGLQ